MAKINGVIQFTGKIGQVVGMKGRNGRNFMRLRTTDIKNPRSLGQNIQRMILATVGQSIGYLKVICNNSVEGKANGNETLSYLRSQWMRMLRVSDINTSPYNYAKKGSGIFITNPYQLSKGSLFVPQYTCNGSDGSLMCAEINRDATKASELFPSIAVGNQITIVSVGLDDRDMGENDAYIPVIKYCRFAFKNDVAAPLEAGSYTLNPEAIDLTKAEGDWGKLVFASGGIDLNRFADNLDIAACAIIVSNIADKKRSTSYLALANNILGLQWPAAEAYPTFGAASTPIDVPSEVYLDNSTTPNSSEVTGVVSLLGTPVVVDGGGSETLDFSNVPGLPSVVKLNVAYNGQQYVTQNIVGVVSGAPILSIPSGEVINVASNGEFTYANNAATVKLTPDGVLTPWVFSGGLMVIDGIQYTF